MKMIKLISSLFLFLLTINSYGGDDKKNPNNEHVNHVISGKVIDISDNQPLAGVQIIVDGLDKVYYTDFDGNYSIKDLPQGEYSIKFRMTSFSEKFKIFQINSNLSSSTIKLFPS